MLEKRTDLAIEIRESFPEDEVEIDGVALQERFCAHKRIRISTVHIINEHGAKRMGKPTGYYVTLEYMDAINDTMWLFDEKKEAFSEVLTDVLADMLKKIVRRERSLSKKKEPICCIVSGLGNRYATPDALGPIVMEQVEMNRHLVKEFGNEEFVVKRVLCGLTPGVMSQTGMESGEILSGILSGISADLLIVVDALATSSVRRLCTTIQITDTGISPGAGIGNNRNRINKETMGVPVIAIGVPTVVDAGTIVRECMEETLEKKGYSEHEISMFLESIAGASMENLFVTPKDIDEKIQWTAKVVAEGINKFSQEG